MIKRKIPLIILFAAIILKVMFFYNTIGVTSNLIIIITITTVLYSGFVLFSSTKPAVSLMVVSIITFIFEGEILYYRYFNRLLSFENLSQAKFVGSVFGVLFQLIQLIDIILIIDIIVLVILFLYDKEKLHFDKKKKIITIAFAVMLVPTISLASFGNDVGVSIINQEFFTYHVKDAIKVYSKKIFKEKEVVIEKMESIAEVVEEKKYTGLLEGKNIITIQIESLQDMVLLKDYNGQELMPFLNSLIEKDSFYFSNYYQQLGRGNTSDAEFSTHNSIYPSMDGITYDKYSDNDFRGLPVLLKEDGYETYAFHGNIGDFWCREKAYKNQGLDNFYSQEDLKEGELIGMGLSDKEVFEQGAQILSEVNSPFYAFFITMTNHNPYELPEEQIHIELEERDKGNLFGKYLQSVRHTDDAIKEFYLDLEKRGMLENTVFVIYGDHHGIIKMDSKYHERISEFVGNEYDFDEMMNVPFIIHSKGLGVTQSYDYTSDQQDCLPTMLNLLGIDSSDLFMVGQDLLNTKDFFTIIQTYMIRGSFIKDDIVFEMSRDGVYENSRAYNKKTRQEVDLDECRDTYERVLRELDYCNYILENNKIIDQ